MWRRVSRVETIRHHPTETLGGKPILSSSGGLTSSLSSQDPMRMGNCPLHHNLGISSPGQLWRMAHRAVMTCRKPRMGSSPGTRRGLLLPWVMTWNTTSGNLWWRNKKGRSFLISLSCGLRCPVRSIPWMCAGLHPVSSRRCATHLFHPCRTHLSIPPTL